MPFEPFGVPADLTQLRQFTPTNYGVMFGGLIMGVKNTLILFNVSVVADQLVLLFGTYLLSRYLFLRRSTVFFVCLAAMHGATSWGEQIYFDIHNFCLFPWAIYAFLLFFERKTSEYLWLWVMVMSLWMIGTGIYSVLIWSFIFLTMGATLFVRQPNIKIIWQWTPRSFVYLGLTAAILGAFCLIMQDLFSSIDLLSRSVNGKNPLNTFLVHGGVSPSLPQYVVQLFSVQYSNKYTGFLPFIFFIWAILKVKDPRFCAFLFSIVALLALSFQGLWSILFYYVIPGMSIFRHLAFFYGPLKILILICAGFGLENFWTAPHKERLKGVVLMVVVGVFLSDALRISSDRLYALALDDATKNQFFSLWLNETKVLTVLTPLLIFIGGLILLEGAVLVFAKIKRKEPAAKTFHVAILILIYCVLFLEAYGVHSYSHKNFPRLSDGEKVNSYAVLVSPVVFQPMRSMIPLPGRQEAAYRLATRRNTGSTYSSMCDFAQFDMCNCPFRVEGYSKGFSDLMENRSNVDRDLIDTLGCGAPKLRFVSQGVYFDSTQEAKEEVSGVSNLFSSVILSGGDARVAKEILTDGYDGSQAPGAIEVTKFTNNELTAKVDVASSKGSWLVYADAYNSGWHAKIDGKQVPVYRAYLVFKAIWVQAGRHEIQFYYRKWPILLSSYFLAIVGTLATMIFIFFLGRQVWLNFTNEDKRL
jgi:hypothetical protein